MSDAPTVSDYEEAAEKELDIKQEDRDAINTTLEQVFNEGSNE